MGIFDEFDKGFARGQNLRYANKERESAYQSGLADLAMKQAEAQNAPEYFGSRAGQMTNQKGLSGLELQYAPQKFQMEQQNSGLTNMLRQLQIQQMKSEMAGSGGFKPTSSMGKLFSDYQQVVAQFGADSPQAQNFKIALDREAQGAPGMTVFDPVTGNPLVSTGNKTTGMGGGSSGTYIDPQTGKIVATQTAPAKTRDFRTIAGGENVADYLKKVQEQSPFAFTVKDEAKGILQGLANRWGADYEYPSKLAAGEAATTTMAEGFLNAFGLNATNENVAKAEKVFKPQKGESQQQWLKRTAGQAEELGRVLMRAQNRLASGQAVGQSQMPQFQQHPPEQINAWAQEAIAKGADPAKVAQRVQQMQGGQ